MAPAGFGDGSGPPIPAPAPHPLPRDPPPYPQSGLKFLQTRDPPGTREPTGPREPAKAVYSTENFDITPILTANILEF